MYVDVDIHNPTEGTQIRKIFFITLGVGYSD